MIKEEIITECENFMRNNIPESRIDYSYLRHVAGCRDYALKLAKIYDADEFVVEIAALLHDTGADAGKSHPKESAKIAREFLSRFNIPSQILERIIACIENHSMGMSSDNLEEQIIRDADGLIFLEDTYKYFAGKLLEKTGSLDEAKKIAMEKTEGMMEKIKTGEGVKMAKEMLPTALEFIKNFNLGDKV